MPDPLLDTASQRPPTGLTEAVRRVVLRTLRVSAEEVLEAMVEDSYGGLGDYLAALAAVWDEDLAETCRMVINTANMMAWNPGRFSNGIVPHSEAGTRALLECIPEPDFRIAVARTARRQGDSELRSRINQICQLRGVPWRLDEHFTFEWAGDGEIEATVVRPALSAVADPRFSGGVKSEFESARAELGLGTPTALSQAIHQSGNAVESAMKVVLDAHGIAYAAGATATSVFERLENAQIAPRFMERIVLAASTPRNRRGGHGAGATAHSVSTQEAEAAFAAAANAITYLHKLLPQT